MYNILAKFVSCDDLLNMFIYYLMAKLLQSYSQFTLSVSYS